MGSVERVSASALILCGIFGTYLNLLQQPNLEVRQGEVSRRGRHLTEDGVRGKGGDGDRRANGRVRTPALGRAPLIYSAISDAVCCASDAKRRPLLRSGKKPRCAICNRVR